MDMSLISSMLATQASNTRSSIATTMMKNNADMERSSVMTLLDGAVQTTTQANLAAGVGGKVDMLA